MQKVYGWSQAHTDLPALVQSLQPKLGELARTALGMVASIGGALLLFLVAFIIAGIIMAFGESGARSTRAIFDRIVGTGRGEEFAKLSTATIARWRCRCARWPLSRPWSSACSC